MTKFILIALGLTVWAVQSPAQLRIQGGNVTITVSSGLPGPIPPSATVSTTGLRWRQETEGTKITIATICPGQKFTLRAVATGISGGGSPAPEVTLQEGMPATDFIVAIPPRKPNNGRCTIQYTAEARFEQGNSMELGDDIHTVIYTIVAE